MMNKFLFLLNTIVLLVLMACSNRNPEMHTVISPDENIVLNFQLKEGSPYYEVYYKGDTIIKPSMLGFVFKDEPALKDQFSVLSYEVCEVNETWRQLGADERSAGYT